MSWLRYLTHRQHAIDRAVADALTQRDRQVRDYRRRLVATAGIGGGILATQAGAAQGLLSLLGVGGSAGAAGSFDFVSNLVSSPVVTTNADATMVYNKINVFKATTGAHNATLPTPVANNLLCIQVSPDSTQLITLVRAGSEKIDNVAASRIMWAGETALLYPDGTDWFKIAGKSIPMACSMYKATDTGTPTTSTYTKINIDTVGLDNTGSMAETANSKIRIQRAGTYFIDFTTWVDPLLTTRVFTAYYKGAGAGASSFAGNQEAPQWTATGYAVGQGPLGLTQSFALSDYLELYGYVIHTGMPYFKCGLLTTSHLALTEIPTW